MFLIGGIHGVVMNIILTCINVNNEYNNEKQRITKKNEMLVKKHVNECSKYIPTKKENDDMFLDYVKYYRRAPRISGIQNVDNINWTISKSGNKVKKFIFHSTDLDVDATGIMLCSYDFWQEHYKHMYDDNFEMVRLGYGPGNMAFTTNGRRSFTAASGI